jgi:ribosomal protein L11 methylase PrmA
MKAYRNALLTVCEKKVVLDVGAGSGVLCIMAARARAEFVYGVEASDLAESTKKAISLTDVRSRIKIYNSKVEELEELSHENHR